MDHKYLSNCVHNEYKVSFYNMEDAIEYVEDYKTNSRKRKVYCEEQYKISEKNIIVTLNVWELPKDNLEN